MSFDSPSLCRRSLTHITRIHSSVCAHTWTHIPRNYHTHQCTGGCVFIRHRHVGVHTHIPHAHTNVCAACAHTRATHIPRDSHTHQFIGGCVLIRHRHVSIHTHIPHTHTSMCAHTCQTHTQRLMRTPMYRWMCSHSPSSCGSCFTIPSLMTRPFPAPMARYCMYV